ncbi:hypothetical protein C8A05DRAFT_38105 [Staphylotrichum tortipilum]|uniref:DUF7136 domain-containing protein n=1 Tax=Staphylotrichum tortipilum TaxID=2831512 RepID=A0AAN6MDS5_9PEZI|nr:hypothetical protein C8A05DRAFT_38105 [Staphylotrichum longicolle]
MEVDLVFPQDGQSYAPTPYMPVVFALRNHKLAQYTDPANWTNNDPYFVYTLHDQFAQPGLYNINLDLWWYRCQLSAEGEFYRYKAETHCDCQGASVVFSTKKDGKAIDLTAPVGEQYACSGQALIVDDHPRPLNKTFPWQEGKISNQCVGVSYIAAENFNWTRPCTVKIDVTTAAAIMADVVNVTSTTCAGPNQPSNCPPKSAAYLLAAVAGPACVAAAVGLFQLLV